MKRRRKSIEKAKKEIEKSMKSKREKHRDNESIRGL